MMAKNVESYIDAAIETLRSEGDVDWELIVVDDHSTDDTRAIIEFYSMRDKRIKSFSNPDHGKVIGTSFGYTKSTGDIIKCIDSDDVLLPKFFEAYRHHRTHDALAHSSFVVDAHLNCLTTYHPNSAWFRLEYPKVLEYLISFPKFSWSFTRELGDKIFPLPSNLPFEDVWMSLLIKKHARSPHYVREPLYLYRQHDNQTFGGILNFSRHAVTFRAQRLLRLIEVLENEPRVIEGFGRQVFDRARRENMFLSGETGMGSLLLDGRLGARVYRVLLTRFFPRTTQFASRLKWAIEAHR